MVIGKRISCPYCPTGTIRADHLSRHLVDAHGFGHIEADEINSRFVSAVSKMTLAQALVYACFGIQLSSIEAKLFILEQRQALKMVRCLCCGDEVQARHMVHKPGGRPGSICKRCRMNYFSFLLPSEMGTIPKGAYYVDAA